MRLLPRGNSILQRHHETRPLPGGSLRRTNGAHEMPRRGVKTGFTHGGNELFGACSRLVSVRLMRHRSHTIRKDVEGRVLYSTSLFKKFMSCSTGPKK